MSVVPSFVVFVISVVFVLSVLSVIFVLSVLFVVSKLKRAQEKTHPEYAPAYASHPCAAR